LTRPIAPFHLGSIDCAGSEDIAAVEWAHRGALVDPALIDQIGVGCAG
jgi:hypothetical protein